MLSHPWVLLLAVLAAVWTTRGALVTPVITWPADGGRMGIRLYHGTEERAVLTRLAFEAPQTSLFADSINTSTTLSVLPHTALVLRSLDELKVAVSDAPVPRMARTRVATREEPMIMATDLAVEPSLFLPDWTVFTRWHGALFLDAHSDIWRQYACWTLESIERALPQLALEEEAECVHRRSDIAVAWNVRPYMYSLPRDAAARKHGRRAGVILLGLARLTAPSVPSEAHAHALGCLPPRCNAKKMVTHHAAAPAYPIVFDLESRRNYLPSTLHFMCAKNNGSKLAFEFMDSTVRETAILACSHSYAINTDSTEIILGLPFLFKNFSRVTYDARAQRVYVAFALPAPSNPLRYIVSFMILVLNAMALIWLDARANFATMVAIVMALNTPAGPSVLPFHAPHAVLELSAVVLSAIELVLTAFYVDPQFAVYYWTVAGMWGFYSVAALAMLVVSIPTFYVGLQRWGRVLFAPNVPPGGIGPAFPVEVAATVPMHAPLVIARHAAAMAVLSLGMLLGLLLSSDSLFMLGIAAFVAGTMSYHLIYYVATALICSAGLHGRARIAFSGLMWGFFVFMTALVVLALLVGTHILLINTVLQGLNSFYPAIFISLTSACILAFVSILGVYQARSDVFGVLPTVAASR